MSQRESGYKRIKLDAYQTSHWVTRALVPYLRDRKPPIKKIWEPPAGRGQMVSALQMSAFKVISSDIVMGTDFLREVSKNTINAIITNPPYILAEEFIDYALTLMAPVGGVVAMLLRADFDSAKTRRHLFADCRVFPKKIVLTKRIRWIEGSKSSPSFNHAWFVWDYRHQGPPTIYYHFEEARYANTPTSA